MSRVRDHSRDESRPVAIVWGRWYRHAMKPVLLWISDETYRRLVARATRDGRSLTCVAAEILDAAVGANPGTRRQRLRATAAAVGILGPVAAAAVSPQCRRRIIASTQGLGAVVDEALADERERP